MSNLRYAQWIEAYVKRRDGAVLGLCNAAVEEMSNVFPELTRVFGHVYVFGGGGMRGHVWLVDPDGNIVDPTASQYQHIFGYDHWTPGTPVRVGKCMNCGDEIWEEVDTLDVEPPRRTVCSEECSDELVREFNSLIDAGV